MFREGLAQLGDRIPRLSQRQIETFEAHFEALRRWNRVLSLTSVRGDAETIERHYGESLFLGARLPPGEWSIADLGSGAGFPGLPVAALRPECRVTLIESRGKKAAFLREVSRELSNVRVLAQRAEEVAESFDWVVSRAVRLEAGERASSWLQKRADRVALLSGADRPDLPFLAWDDPVRLPWGDRTYLNIGRNVSRETSRNSNPHVSRETLW